MLKVEFSAVRRQARRPEGADPLQKTVRVTLPTWKRAKIAAIESGVSLIDWVEVAIVERADRHDLAQTMRRTGAAVVDGAVARPRAAEGTPRG